jgi:hypothetical protein
MESRPNILKDGGFVLDRFKEKLIDNFELILLVLILVLLSALIFLFWVSIFVNLSFGQAVILLILQNLLYYGVSRFLSS